MLLLKFKLEFAKKKAINPLNKIFSDHSKLKTSNSKQDFQFNCSFNRELLIPTNLPVLETHFREILT